MISRDIVFTQLSSGASLHVPTAASTGTPGCLAAWMAHAGAPHARVFDVYGTTETQRAVSYFAAPPAQCEGAGFPNTQMMYCPLDGG